MKTLRALTMGAALSATVAALAFRSFSFSIADSEIYPGTTHDVIVTLSEGYRPDSSAVLYLGLDGILCHAPQVFDSLATSGVIKPVVGVFLQPGLITDSVTGRVLRYNRSNEFDAVTDLFARFIESEVLPAVSQFADSVGECVNWSKAPEDHLIFGLSSGGIAAFKTAWHRPEMWGNIFSGCGTFVPMRGGEELQVWVRKAEPRPIKVVLQDGFSDTWNPLFGSWYEANRMLASALEFSGYDCSFDWAEGGHSVRRATEIFPETVTWLLSAPAVPKSTANNLLKPLLVQDEDWYKSDSVAPVLVFPTIDYPGGGLRVSQDPHSNVLLQSILTSDESPRYTQPFYWLHSLDGCILAKGGMDYDSAGNLWIVTSVGLQILDQNGRVRGILRIPDGLDIPSTGLRITEGAAELFDGQNAYRRRLNVAPALILPPSQGQG